MWVVFILCIIAAFADVLGGALTVVKKLTEKNMMVIAGLGTGFLLGATILDRLPDAMEELPTLAPLFILIGYLLLLLIDQFGMRHLHDHAPSSTSGEAAHLAISRKSALISWMGLLFHTFMDGVIIAGAFSISKSMGILIFLAIAMHKIPEGFSMATISLASGSTRKRALLTAASLALSTLAGAVFTLLIGSVNAYTVKILMALATGTFLFISTTDMVPAIRGKHRLTILCVFIGVAVFYASLLLIKHVGLE